MARARKQNVEIKTDGYPLLGWAVHWSTHEFTIEFKDFVETLKKVGMPIEVARETLAKNALIRAVRKTAKGKDRFHLKTADIKKEAAFTIAHTEVDEQSYDVDFESETKVVFDKKSKDIDVTGRAASQLRDQYQELRNKYTASQFRTVVLRYLQRYCSAVTIREGGGIYFVPALYESGFKVLMDLFQEMGSDKADITLIPIIDTDGAKKSMWKSFIGEVKQDLASFKRELEGFDSKGKEVTEKILETRIKRYKALRQKVETYETVLSGTAQELKDELVQLTKDLQAKLVEDDE